MAGGKVTLKVTIKQNDLDSGPKFEVDGFLSTFHLLLSPQQLTLLQQIIEGIAAQGMCWETRVRRCVLGDIFRRYICVL